MRIEEPGTIMIVDDTPANLKLLDRMLRVLGYQVFSFPRGDLFLAAARQNPPDLVLLDVDMPDLDGFGVCRLLKADPLLQDVPVLFLSALSQVQDKVRAFEVGGLDYITKPFQLPELGARIRTHLKLRRLQREMEAANRDLQARVREQVQEISAAQLAMIQALAKLAESRDDDTGYHLDRVRHYCHLLALEAAKHPDFRRVVTPAFVDSFTDAGPLHDIGKVGIEDRILRKPGKLTSEEFEEMKAHVTLGARTLEQVRERYPRNPLVDMGLLVTRYHHERWDGSGYLEGLRGDAIPLPGRLMALVDVYDALRSPRCYKPALPHGEARALLVEGRGTHFDPRVVDLFLQIEGSFDEVYQKLSG